MSRKHKIMYITGSIFPAYWESNGKTWSGSHWEPSSKGYYTAQELTIEYNDGTKTQYGNIIVDFGETLIKGEIQPYPIYASEQGHKVSYHQIKRWIRLAKILARRKEFKRSFTVWRPGDWSVNSIDYHAFYIVREGYQGKVELE